MKKTLLWATIATLLFAACSKSEIVESTIEPSGDFVATLDNQSRTELDGTSVVWNAEDELTIFTKTEHNRHYKIKELSNNGRTATFGYVGFTGTSNGSISSNYAVYPYNAEATISGDVISTAIAAEQTYNAEKIDLSYALMVAKSQTTSFAFVNSGALMRFNVSKSELIPDSYTLNSIKLSSATNNIAGAVTIDLSAESRAVVASTGSKEITLTAINQEITTEAKSFYVALPAVSFADKDLTVTFTFADGKKSFALPAFNLEQGSTKTIAYTINDSEDFTGTTPGEDNEESIPNNQVWYTTTTNKSISFTSRMFNEAPISNVYNEEKERFEATFANDVKYIRAEAFYDNTTLTSITLPASVTSIIGNSHEDNPSFGENTNLIKFGGPLASEDGLCLIINNKLLAYATGAPASELVIPSGVTTIDCTFRGAKNLKRITIPASVTMMDSAQFDSALTYVNITDLAAWCNICFDKLRDTGTRHGNPLSSTCNLYLNGEQITDLVLPDRVTKISHLAFNRANFNSVTLHEGITEIGYLAFWGCNNLTEITLPSTLTTLYENAFGQCYKLKKVVCKSITPPSAKLVYCSSYFWNGFEENSGLKIYIPSNSSYRSAYCWDKYRSYMVDIPYSWYNANATTYYISSASALYELSLLTNGDPDALATVGADSAINFQGKTVTLSTNINLSSICSASLGSWLPIAGFAGTFDGNNKTISNLYSSGISYMGLFSYTDNSGATIKNLTVNGTIERNRIKEDERHRAGGIIGYANGAIIENCISNVNITITSSSTDDSMYAEIGGVCGNANNTTIIACQYNGNISCDQGDNEYRHYIGGIVGYANATNIVACVKPAGNVYNEYKSAYSAVGGIVGFAPESTTYSSTACYSNSNVKGRLPGMIMGYCTAMAASGKPNTTNCYYSDKTTTETNSGVAVKGIGSDDYGGTWKGYDSGTAAVTDVDTAIADMNTAIDTWNTNNPTKLCNYKYNNVNGVITLGAAN